MPIILYSILRTQKVQNFLADKIAIFLSKELNTSITVGGVDVAFFMDIVLQDLVIKDQKNNTLLFASKMIIDVDRINFLKKKLHVNLIAFDNTSVAILKFKANNQLNIDFLLNYFKSSTTSKDSAIWTFDFESVNINHSSFSFNDETSKSNFSNKKFDPAHIQIKNLQVSISNIYISSDTLYKATLNNLSFSQTNGLKVEHAKVNMLFNQRQLILDDFFLKTENSEIAADININIPKIIDTSFSIYEQLDFNCLFFPSYLSTNDVGLFLPFQDGINKKLQFSGSIKGKISNFKCREIELAYGEKSVLKGNFQFTGLPDIRETYMHLNINHAFIEMGDLKQIKESQLGGIMNVAQLYELFDKLGNVIVKGRFTGFVNDFVSYGSFQSDVGIIKTDISVKQSSNQKGLIYDGKIIGNSVNIGKLANLSNIGKMSFHATLEASGGFDFKKMKILGKATVDSIEINKYKYKDLIIDGSYNKSRFEGNLDVQDNNLNLSFLGIVDFGQRVPEFDFTAKVRNANLTALNVLKRDSNFIVNSDLEMKFRGLKIDEIIGSMSVSNLGLFSENQYYKINNFSVDAYNLNDNNHKIVVRSDFVNAEISGGIMYSELPSSFYCLASRYLPAFFPSQV